MVSTSVSMDILACDKLRPWTKYLPYFKIAVKRKESSLCPETVENKNRNSLEITVTCEQRFPSESHCYEKLKNLHSRYKIK